MKLFQISSRSVLDIQFGWKKINWVKLKLGVGDAITFLLLSLIIGKLVRYPFIWKNKNWIKLRLIDLSKLRSGDFPHPCPILCLVIFDYWKTRLKLVMLENLQSCFLETHSKACRFALTNLELMKIFLPNFDEDSYPNQKHLIRLFFGCFITLF